MSQFYLDGTEFLAYGDFDPAVLFSSTQGGHVVKQLQPAGSMRFASNSPSIGLNLFQSPAAGRKYRLYCDGAEVGGQIDIPTVGGGGSFNTITLATGLDTAAVHEYEIVCATPFQGPPGSWYDGPFLELSGTQPIAAIAHARRQLFAMYGDSTVGYTNALMADGVTAMTDVKYLDSYIACRAASRQLYISGVGGGKVNGTGNQDATIANIPATADQVHVTYGRNDIADLPSGNAAFQSAYDTMVDKIRARIGTAKPIICYKPYRSVSGDTQRDNCGSLIQAAISGKPFVTYENTDDYFPATSFYLPDGTHPNEPCAALIAAKRIPIFLGARATAVALTATTVNWGS